MSKTEILKELSKLTPEERQEVRLCLAELDEEDWLDAGVLTLYTIDPDWAQLAPTLSVCERSTKGRPRPCSLTSLERTLCCHLGAKCALTTGAQVQ